MKTLILTAALAALATAAAAQTAPDYRSTVIRYSDLDLSRPAGANAMISRIRRAADVVCGHRGSTRGVRETALYQDCVSKTMAATVKQVNAPLVSARFGLPSSGTELAAK